MHLINFALFGAQITDKLIRSVMALNAVTVKIRLKVLPC